MSSLDMKYPYSLWIKRSTQSDKGENIEGWQILANVKGTVVTTSNNVLSKDENRFDNAPTVTKTNIRIKPCSIPKGVELEDGMLVKEEFGIKRNYLATSYFPQPDPVNPLKMWYYRLELTQSSTSNYTIQ
jgi:hypothetical protein